MPDDRQSRSAPIGVPRSDRDDPRSSTRFEIDLGRADTRPFDSFSFSYSKADRKYLVIGAAICVVLFAIAALIITAGITGT